MATATAASSSSSSRASPTNAVTVDSSGQSSTGTNPAPRGYAIIRNQGILRVGDDFGAMAEYLIPVRLLVGKRATLAMGSRIRINHGALIAARQRIDIDDDVWIGDHAIICDSGFADVETDDPRLEPKPIVIGSSMLVSRSAWVM